MIYAMRPLYNIGETKKPPISIPSIRPEQREQNRFDVLVPNKKKW